MSLAIQPPPTLTTHRLPLELLRTIVENVHDTADLLAISLSSSALRAEAQRTLFRAPFLPTPLSHLKFLRTIMTSPKRLALLVDTYTHFGISEALVTPELKQALHERVAAGLKVMTNLTRLGYRAIGTDSSADILLGCSFQLRALAWVCNGDDTRILLHDVLPCQRELRHLGLLCPSALSPDDIVAAKGLCPKLRSLAGPRSIFPAFVAGRHMRYLHWTIDINNIDDDDSDSPSLELGDVEYLVHGAELDYPLSDIAAHFKSVNFLRINCRQDVRMSGGTSAQNLLLLFRSDALVEQDGTWQALSQLPKLEDLLLVNNSLDDPLAPSTRRDIVSRIFMHCNTIQRVYLQVEKRHYMRYFRSVLPSTPQSEHLDASQLHKRNIPYWRDFDRGGCSWSMEGLSVLRPVLTNYPKVHSVLL